MGKFLLMGKFLHGQVFAHGSGPRPPGPGAARRGRARPGPARGPRARGLGAGAMSKNLPMKELAHEQELAHSLTCRGGVGGVGEPQVEFVSLRVLGWGVKRFSNWFVSAAHM